MEATITEVLYSISHSQLLVFSFLFLVMYASSFGLPFPEEVTLLTLGFLVYVSNNPDPLSTVEPPTPINIHLAAALAFIAVLSSDVLVYELGRKFGKRILALPVLRNFAKPELMARVEKWMQRWGYWSAGVFRFTPGVRFPGHLSCGMLGVTRTQFVAIDGLAALVSVPTQIYAVGLYGKEIIDVIKRYQPWVILVFVIAILIVYRKTVLELALSVPKRLRK